MWRNHFKSPIARLIRLSEHFKLDGDGMTSLWRTLEN